MEVKLLYHTPLWVCSQAIRTCWDSHCKSDTSLVDVSNCGHYMNYNMHEGDDDGSEVTEAGQKDKALIERVGNKNKHGSTLEHLNYTFYIQGISRACLQELARHRHASLSVKSTRYTLKELKNEKLLNTNFEIDNKVLKWKLAKKYCVLTGVYEVDAAIVESLCNLKDVLEKGISNDIAKYCLPESYRTELTWTINARSLQNFLSLRTSKYALKEIQKLAKKIYVNLPEEHKYLFTDFINTKI